MDHFDDNDAPQKELPIRIRKIDQTDVPLIFNSWLKSYKGAYFAKGIHPKSFYAEHHKVVSNLLQTCETFVAVDDSDATNVYGWICGEYIDGFLVVHFIYVKHTYRNLGVATALLRQFQVHDSGVSFYTHHNMISERLAVAYRFMYNPYMALIQDYRANKLKNDLDVSIKVKDDSDDPRKRRYHP